MKPRFYVETSVISYLAARPSRNALTAFRQVQTRRRLDIFLELSVLPLHDGVSEFG